MAIKNPFENLTKTQRYIVIAGGAGIGIFALVAHHKKTGSWSPFATGTASASSSGSTTTGTDPVTGLPYTQDGQEDPITGLTYLAEAQQYGSVAAAEASVSAFGQSTATGSGIPVNPASPASTGSINTPVGTSVYTSNAAWAQAATAGLASVGYNETDVATALGAYLTQTPLTPSQVTLVNVAIAEYGPAPIGNLQVIQQPVKTPAPPPITTPSSGGSNPPPKVTKPGMVSGYSVSGITGNGFKLSWRAEPGATDYPVRVTYQGQVVFKDTVNGTSVNVTGLEPNRHYTTHVAASNSAGTSAESNGPVVLTK